MAANAVMFTTFRKIATDFTTFEICRKKCPNNNKGKQRLINFLDGTTKRRARRCEQDTQVRVTNNPNILPVFRTRTLVLLSRPNPLTDANAQYTLPLQTRLAYRHSYASRSTRRLVALLDFSRRRKRLRGQRLARRS